MLAVKKGQTADELRRKKIMAKKTQEQINKAKAADHKNENSEGGATKSVAQTSQVMSRTGAASN